MELVCDNSELNGIWGAEASDILVIGGYAIRRDMTVGLLDRVKAFMALTVTVPSNGICVTWIVRLRHMA